ncbi:hypothetical protein F511_47694 [Dorcoceras hygrometricum]|uniref:Uncharacterized protein n=1 Tax=Dorcoceras hygrometricum TaxID=472368 RepID=A0A2Z6ZRE2_9LAMI|nr:hypothetical protein F511_47694 [Dorcoceras hygrometricum]
MIGHHTRKLLRRWMLGVGRWSCEEAGRWPTDVRRAMAHDAAWSAALVAAVRGLAPHTFFVVAVAAALRCSGDVVTAEFF